MRRDFGFWIFHDFLSIPGIYGDFFYLMADIMAESVQYDRQDELCKPLVEAFRRDVREEEKIGIKLLVGRKSSS